MKAYIILSLVALATLASLYRVFFAKRAEAIWDEEDPTIIAAVLWLTLLVMFILPPFIFDSENFYIPWPK